MSEEPEMAHTECDGRCLFGPADLAPQNCAECGSKIEPLNTRLTAAEAPNRKDE